MNRPNGTLAERRTTFRIGWLLLASMVGAALLAGLTPLHAGAIIDLSGTWKFKGDWQENGQLEGWQSPEFDDSTWRDLDVPGAWELQGVQTLNPRWVGTQPDDGYNGYAWYRRHFATSDDWSERKATLRIGAIDDMDWTYVNGKLVGSTTGDKTYDDEREYELPPGTLKAAGEDNVIAIRVCDQGGVGGIIEGPVQVVEFEEHGHLALPGPSLKLRVGDEELVVTSGGERVPAREYAETRGDMVKVGGGLTVPESTRVDGDAVAVGGSVDVRGYVTGEAVAVGGSVRVRRGAVVDGDVVAVGGAVIREEGAAIHGEITQVTFLPWAFADRFTSNPFAAAFGWWPMVTGPFAVFGRFIGRVITWGVLALILALLFPKRLEVMARALPLYPGWAAFQGVLGLVLTPAAVAVLIMVAVLACVILAITIIGIALIPAVALVLACAILGLGVILLFGLGGVWLSIGQAMIVRLGKAETGVVPAVLLGVLLCALASALPLVGTLVLITLLIFAYGVALMTGVGASPEWTQNRFRSGARPVPTPATAPAPPDPPLEPPTS